MQNGPIEVYQPRVFSNHSVWAFETLQFKIYGLLAEGQQINTKMIAKAKQFIDTEVLTRVAAMGESNDLGFVIIHPGDLGVSISAHWWVQGSVLCQHNYRQLYGAPTPMDTVARPVVACVWELALINAEQEAWRQTMMRDTPDRAAYLRVRPAFAVT